MKSFLKKPKTNSSRSDLLEDVIKTLEDEYLIDKSYIKDPKTVL